MTCDFRDCDREAICKSGNIGDAFVCQDHFQLVNGTKEGDLSLNDKIEIKIAYERAKRRDE